MFERNELEKLVFVYQPISFLRQFEELIGGPVGLEDYEEVPTIPPYFSLRQTVRGEHKEYGRYYLNFAREDQPQKPLQRGELSHLEYSGWHPLPGEDVFLYAGCFGNDYARRDRNPNIVFPGLIKNPERIPNKIKIRTFPILTEPPIFMEEISPQRVKVRRNDSLGNHGHIGGASCEIHYDVTVETDKGEVPLGYVAIVPRTVQSLSVARDIYDALVDNGADNADGVVHFNLFHPFWNTRDRYREVIQRVGNHVIDQLASELKLQGFSWGYGLFTDFEQAQFLGSDERYMPKRTSPHGVFYTKLSDLTSGGRLLTQYERRDLIDFTVGKPNLNLGLIEISEICKRLTKEDLAVLSDSLNLAEEQIVQLLAGRLSNVFLRSDFQKSAQTARETIEKLKRKWGE